MHYLAIAIVFLALAPLGGCFVITDFSIAKEPEYPPKNVCVPSQGGFALAERPLRCFKGRAEHSGNCDASGLNCEPGCRFSLRTEEPGGGTQALVPINRDVFIPEGQAYTPTQAVLQSTPGSTEKRGMKLHRLYAGADVLYWSQVDLFDIRVSANCP